MWNVGTQCPAKDSLSQLAVCLMPSCWMPELVGCGQRYPSSPPLMQQVVHCVFMHVQAAQPRDGPSHDWCCSTDTLMHVSRLCEPAPTTRLATQGLSIVQVFNSSPKSVCMSSHMQMMLSRPCQRAWCCTGLPRRRPPRAPAALQADLWYRVFGTSHSMSTSLGGHPHHLQRALDVCIPGNPRQACGDSKHQLRTTQARQASPPVYIIIIYIYIYK